MLVLAPLLELAPPAAAQDSDEPFVETDFAVTETMPGQPLTLRLTVLVPTFMPEPVEFPSLEQPDLRVIVPARATAPTSRRIGAQTWSGVTRRYELLPLVAGDFDIAPRPVLVSFASPGGGDPAQARLMTPRLSLSAVIPTGAANLDPFIAARSLELEQSVEGETTGLAVGAAVTRTVTARIEGASPVVLPGLLPDHRIDGFSTYPDQARVEESDDAGTLAGTRTESVTLMAKSGGGGRTPDIAIEWFDIDSGTVETAGLDGFDLSIDAPRSTPADEPPGLVRAASVAMALMIAVLALFVAFRYASPWLAARLADHTRARRASEAFSYRALVHSIDQRDYRATLEAFDVWASRLKGTDPRRHQSLRTALDTIAARIYGGAPHTDAAPKAEWHTLKLATAAARKDALRHTLERHALPPLNPGWRA